MQFYVLAVEVKQEKNLHRHLRQVRHQQNSRMWNQLLHRGGNTGGGKRNVTIQGHSYKYIFYTEYDDSLAVLAAGTDEKTLYIPSEIDGKEVTRVGKKVMSGLRWRLGSSR